MCNVRPPKPADFERMAELAGQLGYPSTGRQVQQRLDTMRDSNQYAIYVAELPGGEIAGWISIYVFRAAELEPFVEISGLVVDEAARSHGIGKLLLAAAEGWAREHGFNGIEVRSNVMRERALAFYQRNGFERGKTQATLVKSF
jgi:GNAT superfamily N-acetyltransferase